MGFLLKGWNHLSITLKFGGVLAILLISIIAIAAISYLGLETTNTETDNALESVAVQRSALEMNRELQDAGILQRDFFLQYPIIGVDEARSTYVQPAIAKTGNVVTVSQELKEQAISSESITSTQLEDNDRFEFTLSTTQRSNITLFLESVGLVEDLYEADTGLQAQMLLNLGTLQQILENDENQHDKTNETLQLSARDFLITGQESAYERLQVASADLRTAIEASEDFDEETKATLLDTLDEIDDISEEILDANSTIRDNFDDLNLLADYVNPISEELVVEADNSVEASRIEIENTRETVNRSLIGVAIAAILLAIVASTLLNNSITRNIIRLTATAQELQAGNLDARVNVRSNDEIGVLGNSFNQMASDLQSLINTLEERVQARTRDLEIAAEVSREAATTVDPDLLLPRVTELMTNAFNLYYASVYLYDDSSQTLQHQASASPIAKNLETLAGRTVAITDKGIISQAGREQSVVVINDTASSDNFVQLDVLPDTKSEVTLPMMVGNELIGVLDLQANVQDRFTDVDLNVLQPLADRIAVTIRNAQLFAEAEKSRAEAEEANRVKSQFLANMSHELRTPLNAILNFTAFVKDGDLGDVNEDQVDALSQAHGSGKHLLSLINDVLDLTKIEAGLMDFFIQQIDLNEILGAIEAVAKGLTKDKPKVSLKTNIDKDLPITYGDKRRIRQIFLNLLSNAVKFTLEGTITINAQRQSDKVLFQVMDTGIGIAPEDQELIFESFKQAKHNLSESIGTGLGLPITKYFVESHGGRIWVESDIDQGTTFNVELPILSEEQAQQINTKLQAKAN